MDDWHGRGESLCGADDSVVAAFQKQATDFQYIWDIDGLMLIVRKNKLTKGLYNSEVRSFLYFIAAD